MCGAVTFEIDGALEEKGDCYELAEGLPQNAR